MAYNGYKIGQAYNEVSVKLYTRYMLSILMVGNKKQKGKENSLTSVFVNTILLFI